MALVVLDRAAALNRRDFTRFDEFAAYFDAHGCPFQARRTHAVRAYVAAN